MTDDNVNQTVSTVFQMLPIIMISLPFIWLYYRLTGRAYESYENDDSIEQEEILKRRFAKGDIGCFEYTERMARL